MLESDEGSLGLEIEYLGNVSCVSVGVSWVHYQHILLCFMDKLIWIWGGLKSALVCQT